MCRERIHYGRRVRVAALEKEIQGMAKKPETQFRTGTVDPYLKTLKCAVDFSIQQQTLCGHPDKILCIRGRFVALEIKNNDEDPAPLQQYFLDEVTKKGGVAWVVKPKNWHIIKNKLHLLDEGLL